MRVYRCRKKERDYANNYYAQHKKLFLARRRVGADRVVDALKDSQGNLCAICGKADNLHIDHDHNTGKIRGLLCAKCNIALGCMQAPGHAYDEYLNGRGVHVEGWT
jgi:hypothetical protein